MKIRLMPLLLPFLVFYTHGVFAAEKRKLHGHVHPAWTRMQSEGDLPPTNQISLAIGLPLRNQESLSQLLRQLYDPGSTNYHHYLNQDEFAEKFGPSEHDYQAAINFASTNGLEVTAMHSNRMLLGVTGSVGDVNKTFQVRLRVYQHPTEARYFYAPRDEPSIPRDLPILHVSGLDNFTTPHPRNLRSMMVAKRTGSKSQAGSGPDGAFWGNDFRTAYVPGTALTGAGQTLGLFELDGYYQSDITAYANQAGLTNVPLKNVLIDGFKGIPTDRRPGSGNEEVALDIEVAISMAPGLSQLLVYEGSPRATATTVNHILNRMATDNLAKQLSCSWGFDIDVTTQQIFQQYAAQGQSFFLASGDSGAFSAAVDQPADDPYITVVGGTSLVTGGSGEWTSETAWVDSGGGISTLYPIPFWQQGIDVSANQGSSAMRNLPDVAMLADNVFAIADRGQSDSYVGTSISAPLWAAFTAMVNQQAAVMGQSPIGFINPAIYAIGKGPSYTTVFHDITIGDNTTGDSPDRFFAVPGYDLCTGWGTPNGTNLINALLTLRSDDLLVTSPLGFTASGPVGGPFNITSQSYTLTNVGSAPLRWSAISTSTWLNVSPSSGTLAPADSATVTVGLNATATNFLIGSLRTVVSFINQTSGATQFRDFNFVSGNGGFENGDFSDWTLSGSATANYTDSIDNSSLTGSLPLTGVDDSEFVHSGIYGAFLGQTTSLGSLSQTLPTVAGQRYILSFWLGNPATGTPNEFRVAWDSNILFDQVNLGRFAWTNMQFTVTATQPSSVLKFSFRNDRKAFALDQITVQPISSTIFQSVTETNGLITLTISAASGQLYQLQYTTDLNSMIWTNLGDPVAGSDDFVTVSDTIESSQQRFYRIVESP